MAKFLANFRYLDFMRSILSLTDKAYDLLALADRVAGEANPSLTPLLPHLLPNWRRRKKSTHECPELTIFLNCPPHPEREKKKIERKRTKDSLIQLIVKKV